MPTIYPNNSPEPATTLSRSPQSSIDNSPPLIIAKAVTCSSSPLPPSVIISHDPHSDTSRHVDAVVDALDRSSLGPSTGSSRKSDVTSEAVGALSGQRSSGLMPPFVEDGSAGELEGERRNNSSSPFPSPRLRLKSHHLNHLKISRSLAASSTSTTATSLGVPGESSGRPVAFPAGDLQQSSGSVWSPFQPSPLSSARLSSSDSASPGPIDISSILKVAPAATGSGFHWKQNQKMRRRDSLPGSSGELYGSLVGSYEESILTGRLSTPPSKPIAFVCQIGVLAMEKSKSYLRCPPHVTVPFKASFYEWMGREHSNSMLSSSFSHSQQQARIESVFDTAGHLDHRARSTSDTGAILPLSPPSYFDENADEFPRRSLSTASTDSSMSSIVSPVGRNNVMLPGNHMTDQLGTPYVGNIDLEWGLGADNAFGYPHYDPVPADAKSLPANRSSRDPKGAFRIPLKGQLQVMIKNPNKAVVKVFLIPYDYRELKPYCRTFLRQKCLSISPNSADIDSAPGAYSEKSQSLRYAVQLQFLCLPSSTHSDNGNTAGRRLYLYKNIRAVFSHRNPDGTENLKIVYETPDGRFDEPPHLSSSAAMTTTDSIARSMHGK
eukprot:Partr_v1_DN28797_c3_g1_i2_m62465 putative family with sequence similarity 214, member